MENITCVDCNKEFLNKRGLANHLRGGCFSLRKESLNRNCTYCGILMFYNNITEFKRAMNNNYKCKSCANRLREFKDETKKKISETLKDKYESGTLVANMKGAHSEKSIKKQSVTRSGKKLNEEHKINIGIGVKNSEKYILAVKSPEFSKKMSVIKKNKIVSEETKQKQRIIFNKRLKTLFGNKFHPNFNKNACHYFDKIMKETNSFIQHALNGGEYYIEELGYWVDGYDEINNIVYEYDEKHHFNKDGIIKNKDIIREEKIKAFLSCSFIRFKK